MAAAETEIRSEFCCQVCLGCYDPEGHRPLLLPACGHTFCASCVQLLGQQGKTSCPKCRKDKAVQPVSSLPVNYSLLEIVQSMLSGAMAKGPPSSPKNGATGEKRPHRSPPELSDSPRQPDSGGLFSRLRRTRIKQDTPQPPCMRGNPRHAPGASSSPSGYTSFPPPVLEGHTATSNPDQAGCERELHDELDFQMAVHLTFCKDWNHDFNQHTSCPVWRRQNEEDNDLTTSVTLMHKI